MPEIGFRHRLAFVRWLRARGQFRLETDAELAGALGVGESWVEKWRKRDDAPLRRQEADAIAAALGPMGVPLTWLYDGQGEDPPLWTEWLQGVRSDTVPKRKPRRGVKADQASKEKAAPKGGRRKSNGKAS